MWVAEQQLFQLKFGCNLVSFRSVKRPIGEISEEPDHNQKAIDAGKQLLLNNITHYSVFNYIMNASLETAIKVLNDLPSNLRNLIINQDNMHYVFSSVNSISNKKPDEYIIRFIVEFKERILELLQETNVKEKGPYGRYAPFVEHIVKFGRHKILNKLIEIDKELPLRYYNCRIDTRTLLHYALESYEDNTTVIKLLLNNGADLCKSEPDLKSRRL
jgi:hypothetical protein